MWLVLQNRMDVISFVFQYYLQIDSKRREREREKGGETETEREQALCWGRETCFFLAARLLCPKIILQKLY